VVAFPVSEKKAKALRERFVALGCLEKDIEEVFFGRCGVGLRHHPSGVRVRCTEGRCQALNRFRARRTLADELEARLQAKTRHIVKAEKIREMKGRTSGTNRRSVADGLAQFALRPLVPPGQQPPKAKALGRLLTQLEKIKEAETG
jgi:peptide chain release factor